jgi:hypothetical protein
MATNMTATQGMTPSGQDLSSINPSTGFFNNASVLGSGDSGGSQETGEAAAAGGTGSSWDLSGILSGLGSFASGLLPSASTVSGIAPYLAAAGLGLNQANKAAGENKAQAGQLAALGAPLMGASNQLLQQAQAGKLSPAQQAYVDQTQTQGQQLIDAAAPLASIANTAFAQYQAGQLQPGQQQQIDAWTASAKQTLRQTLGNQGISDSSVLASQDAAIDSQAQQLKANLMAQNLQVGDQQFSQWLTATGEGQKVQQEGKKFAVDSINTMLSQALGFAQAGMQPEEQAVQLAIQSNNQLSQSVTGLFQSLMMAYAQGKYKQTGGGEAAGGGVGKAAGAVGSALTSLGGVPSSALADQEARMYGGNTDAISSQYDWSQGLNFTAGFNDGTSGYNLNSDGTVDTSTFQNFFYDPSTLDLPEIDFGGG